MSLRIANAMAEIKLAIRKIASNREFILRNLVRDAERVDPFAKDGSTQAAQIASKLQAINDNARRVVALRSAIGKKNIETLLEIEGIEMSVAEWLIWRRDVLPQLRATMEEIVRQIAGATNPDSMASTRRRLSGERVDGTTKWEINISEQLVHEELQKLDAIEERLDGALSVLNANTFLDVD